MDEEDWHEEPQQWRVQGAYHDGNAGHYTSTGKKVPCGESKGTEGKKFPLDRGKKVPSEVESELQLDSNSSQMPPSMPFSNSKPSPMAEGLGKIQVPQGKKLPTVEERRAQFEYMRTHGGDEAVWIKLKGEFDPEVTA